MLDLRVYTINFQYSDKGEVSKVVVNFSTVNQGDNYINGNVSLTAEEFNKGNTIEQVKAKLVEELQAVKE